MVQIPMRLLDESHFTCMLRRPKAPAVGKKGLNRSLIGINSLISCVFATSENEIIFLAKVSLIECQPVARKLCISASRPESAF